MNTDISELDTLRLSAMQAEDANKTEPMRSAVKAPTYQFISIERLFID